MRNLTKEEKETIQNIVNLPNYPVLEGILKEYVTGLNTIDFLTENMSTQQIGETTLARQQATDLLNQFLYTIGLFREKPNKIGEIVQDKHE